MSQLIKLPADIFETRRGLNLILTRDSARPQLTELIASLILSGPLFVVSASEWFPSHVLSRTIRRRSIHVKDHTGQLQLARASTCFRLLDILSNIPVAREPILILDFLHTFYDSDVPLRTRFLQLRKCCQHLKRCSSSRIVIVLTREMPTEDYQNFSPILRAVADRAVYLEPEPKQGAQPALF